jgi:hypothetical protein
MPRELYVYFRADATRADAVRTAVTAMQAQLRCEFPGLQARLLRRPDSSGGQHTWMETYAMLQDAHLGGELMTSTIEQRALPWRDLLDGARHIEVYDACA